MAENVDRTLETLADAGRTVARQRARQTPPAETEERVRTMESEVIDLKGRVNSLIFVLIGAVATQVVIRLFG
jgi:HAMP domain-containing protein